MVGGIFMFVKLLSLNQCIICEYVMKRIFKYLINVVVSLCKKLYPHYSVLVSIRNRFECDLNIKNCFFNNETIFVTFFSRNLKKNWLMDWRNPGGWLVGRTFSLVNRFTSYSHTLLFGSRSLHQHVAS